MKKHKLDSDNEGVQVKKHKLDSDKRKKRKLDNDSIQERSLDSVEGGGSQKKRRKLDTSGTAGVQENVDSSPRKKRRNKKKTKQSVQSPTVNHITTSIMYYVNVYLDL